jgi:hypothetical protein
VVIVRDAALSYLRSGLSVIAIRPKDKRPFVSWEEFQRRRPTEAEVRIWYHRWPDAGVAIVCVQISGLVVVDCDPRNGDGLAHIEHRLPPTPTVETGGGGRHLYFSARGLVIPKVPGLLPGVDLQGEASCVVAPPSIHPSGRAYRWLPGQGLGEAPLAPLPAFVRQLLALRLRPEEDERPPRRRRPRTTAALTLDQVLSLLHGVRRGGRGWVARCPAHDDREPSLSIAEDGGRLLIHCFAGCTFDEILDALRQEVAR